MQRQHHIRRIDDKQKRTHAWLVQVQSRGETTIGFFSDGRFGGKRAALQAATHFRDEVLRTARDGKYHLWRRNRKRRNNTSGSVGVGRYVSRERRRGGVVERITWQAFWDGPGGKRQSRKFSVNLYGEKRARDLARHARQEAMRIVCGCAK